MPELEKFVQSLVFAGRFGTPSEAVDAALRLMKEQDDSNPLRREVEVGMAQVVAGRGLYINVDDVKRRASRRLVRR